MFQNLAFHEPMINATEDICLVYWLKVTRNKKLKRCDLMHQIRHSQSTFKQEEKKNKQTKDDVSTIKHASESNAGKSICFLLK